mmetsp:Transcript_31881/g.105752  ORF Transcript_31881/g.105752 Transcript_31881/m.105752 type:complete len:202 (+) Transcript_31881:849-1454(+)
MPPNQCPSKANDCGHLAAHAKARSEVQAILPGRVPPSNLRTQHWRSPTHTLQQQARSFRDAFEHVRRSCSNSLDVAHPKRGPSKARDAGLWRVLAHGTLRCRRLRHRTASGTRTYVFHQMCHRSNLCHCNPYEDRQMTRKRIRYRCLKSNCFHHPLQQQPPTHRAGDGASEHGQEPKGKPPVVGHRWTRSDASAARGCRSC